MERRTTVFILMAAAGIWGALLIVPGWVSLPRGHAVGRVVFFLPALGVAAWVALVAVGVGEQSLSNVVEVLFVQAFAVVAAYVLLILAARDGQGRRLVGVMAFAAVLAFAVVLRLTMPGLPE